MCGILGFVGESRNSAAFVEDGLFYNSIRGYHSIGAVAFNENEPPEVMRRLGGYEREQGIAIPVGTTVLAHNRWATTGNPDNLADAHPHAAGGLFGVMNGDVLNFRELREDLVPDVMDTVAGDSDTEIAISYIYQLMEDKSIGLHEALSIFAKEYALGNFAFALVDSEFPAEIVSIKKGNINPVLIGESDGQAFISSQPAPLYGRSSNMVELESGMVVVTSREGSSLFDFDGDSIAKPKSVTVPKLDVTGYERGDYDTFYAKEISIQPESLASTIQSLIEGRDINIDIGLSSEEAQDLESIRFMATGSSQHAAWLGVRMIEQLYNLDLPDMTVDLPGDFQDATYSPGAADLVVAVSQSGSTGDILRNVHELQPEARLVAIVNTAGSDIDRLAESSIHLNIGTEQAVAATKSFTSQVVSTMLLCAKVAELRGSDEVDVEAVLDDISRMPEAIGSVVERADDIKDVVESAFMSLSRDHAVKVAKEIEEISGNVMTEEQLHELAKSRTMLDVVSAGIIGNGPTQAVSYEVALKNIEVACFINLPMKSELMKHGFIALAENPYMLMGLLDGDPDNDAATKKGLKEFRAQKGQTFVIGPGAAQVEDAVWAIDLEDHGLSGNAMAVNVVGQLMSLFVGELKGLPVDRPKQLAKTVAV